MSLINILQPHPEDRLHLRLHRARSVILTAQEFVPPVSSSGAPASCVCPFPRTNTWEAISLLPPVPNAESLLSKSSAAWRQAFLAVSRADPASAICVPASAPTFWKSPLSFFTFLFRFSVPLPTRISDRCHVVLRTNSLPRLTEIRAAQRTFEGAYIRTAIGQFSFALVVLKIFTAEFYSIGALFATYGVGIMLVSLYRRYEGNRQFFSEMEDDGMGRKKFRTSGNAVVVLTALSFGAYVSLLVLTMRLGE